MTRTDYRFVAVTILSLLAGLTAPSKAAPPSGRSPAGSPQQPPPKTGTKPGDTKGTGRTGGAEGTHAKGTVNEFKSAKDTPGEDDTLVGTLSIKPLEKGAKPVNLRVHRNTEYKFGETKLDPETAPDLLWKGLMVSVTFDVDQPTDAKKKAPAQKALKMLSIESLEIEGTVIEIGDDFITINAKPLKGDWPDAEPPKSGSTPLAKTVKPRPIKFKTIEKITRVLNKDLRLAELGEYAKDEKVEAIVGIGKGKAQGLLLSIHPPVLDRSKEDKRTAQQPKPIIPKQSGGGRKAGG